MLFEFESTFLLEQPWQLSAKDASLSENYNPSVRPAGMSGVVDIGSKGEVQTEVLRETPDNDFVFTLHQQILDSQSCAKINIIPAADLEGLVLSRLPLPS